MRTFKSSMAVVAITFLMGVFAVAANADSPFGPQKRTLIIGGSLMNGATPYNTDTQAPFGGWSTNSGDYLSLGEALMWHKKLVVNEAQAGAGTFHRLACGGPVCGPAYWNGYQTQFNRALTRVTPPGAPATAHNADYLIVGMSNDCLHSDAFGVPQGTTSACTIDELNETITTMINIGQQALDIGIVPTYSIMPKYEDLDLDGFLAFGLLWVISEADYNLFRTLHMARIPLELDGSILVDAWEEFQDLGDGLHPDKHTTFSKAAPVFLEAWEDYEAAQ